MIDEQRLRDIADVLTHHAISGVRTEDNKASILKMQADLKYAIKELVSARESLSKARPIIEAVAALDTSDCHFCRGVYGTHSEDCETLAAGDWLDAPS